MKLEMRTASLVFLALLLVGCPDDDGTRDDRLDVVDDATADLDATSDTFDEQAVDLDRDGLDDTMSGDASLDGTDMPIQDSPPDIDAGIVEVTVETTSQWQRGAVSVTYDVDASASASCSVSAEYATSDPRSASFVPASRLEGFGDEVIAVGPGRHRFVWDSFADITADVDEVWVRVVASDGTRQTTSPAAGPFALLNDPDRPRAVLMTSSINGNDQVRRLVWSHDTGMSYEDAVHTVSLSPDAVVFEPGGRTAAVVGSYDQQIVFFVFEPDGSIRELVTLETPDRRFDAAEFSPDSAVLYLMLSSGTDYGGGIYTLALDPWTALPVEGATPALLYAVFVPAAFALVPDQRGIVLHGTSRDDPRGAVHMQWIDLEGELLDDVYFAPVDSSAEYVAVSPDGRWALASYFDMFSGVGGAQLVELTELDALAVAEESSAVVLSWAGDVAFHSGSTAAIVTQIDPDRVISLSIGNDGTLAQADSVVLGAADRVARTAVGSDRDVFFVTTVHPRSSALGSGLGIVRLSPDGSLVLDDPFYLGPGIEKIPSDVGVQY